MSIFAFSLYLKNLIDNETTQKFKFKGDAVINNIASKILIDKTSAELLANNMAAYGLQLNKNQFIDILQRDIKTNNDIFGAGVWFEPYRYRQNLKYFGPYCYRNQDNKIISTFMYSTPEYNYLKWDWYKNVKNEQKKVVWSIPYYDPVLKTTFITISVPMYNDNKFIGVVTTDFILSTLQDLIKEAKISKNGWTFVIDKKGNYIAHKDKNKIMNGNILTEKNQSLVKLGKQILEKKKGLTTFKSDNEKNLVYFSPIADSGLYLGSVMPTNDLYGASVLGVFEAGFLLTIILFIILNIAISRHEKFDQKRLNYILDNMGNGLIMLNKNSVIEYCNPAIEKLFSYNPQELLNKNINIIFYDQHIMNRLINGSDMETIGIKKDNTEFPIEIKISEIFVNNGVKYLLDIYDVSKHKEIEKMKDEFISIVSHELRTPLTSIQGSLGLVCSNVLGIIPKKINDLLVIAYKNSIRLTSLINDILDVKKIEAGQMDLNIESLDIVSIINDVIIANKSYAEQYNVDFVFDSPNEGIIVKTDKTRLIQIITNLLSNAAKYSYPDKKVSISVLKTDSVVRTSISNYGDKIPEEFKDKIFQKFLQLNSSNTRSHGGTGLGLNICKNLVEKLGGTIDFESAANGLTTFYFDIPNYK